MISIQDLYLFLIIFLSIILIKIILNIFVKSSKGHTEKFHKEKWKGFGLGLLTKKKNPEIKENTHICKKCGAVMVKTSDDSKELYTCYNYPKCNYVIK